MDHKAFDTFNSDDFLDRVSRATQSVRRILHANRNPIVASDVHHRYDDKYLLVEVLVNTAIASQLLCFKRLGLDPQRLATLRTWTADKSVSLVFRAVETCEFVREECREVENRSKLVVEEKVQDSSGEKKSQTEYKSVAKIKECIWKTTISYELFACQFSNTPARKIATPKKPPEGDFADDSSEEEVEAEIEEAECGDDIEVVPEVKDDGEALTLLARTGTKEWRSSTACPPQPARAPETLRLDLSWLLRSLDTATQVPCFSVRRELRSCATPVRNADVEKVIDYFGEFYRWAAAVNSYLASYLGRTVAQVDIRPISSVCKDVIEPVLPLMEEKQIGSKSIEEAPQEDEGPLAVGTWRSWQSVVLSVTDANKLLREEGRMLDSRINDLEEIFGSADGAFTAVESTFALVLQHGQRVAQQLSDSFLFVENMLRTQLIAAIGKDVSTVEFANYMRFHQRKLFTQEFQPKPFSYSVRRSLNHVPEGVLSIEAQSLGQDSASEPIATLVNDRISSHPMQFRLNAATTVTFQGPRFLHAFCLHQFSSDAGGQLTLEARARQFSSMIVVVGRIASGTTFDPQFAAIVQNKEELSIPLALSKIPTPKEFRDAIESLSTEQRKFAEAFRAMQLESTLFGVLTIQVKPQMEKLLRLPEDSLTKEIFLMQDLVELFLEYQIPSDQVSFSGDASASMEAKLAKVKTQVEYLQDILKQKMQKEIDDFKTKAGLELKAISQQSDSDVTDSDSDDGAWKSTIARERAKAELERKKAEAEFHARKMKKSKRIKLRSQQPRGGGCGTGGEELFDYTEIPKEIDRRLAEFDKDGCLRPTVIAVGTEWSKREREKTRRLQTQDQQREKQQAFDLLDALTKSGKLPVAHAELHIILAATHCFDKSVVETVIQDNVNPIDKVEQSIVMMAAALHRRPVHELVQPIALARLKATSPQLFDMRAFSDGPDDAGQRILGAFRQYFVDGDLRITRGELLQFVNSVSPERYTSEQIENLLEGADLSHDGFVSFRQFMEWVATA